MANISDRCIDRNTEFAAGIHAVNYNATIALMVMQQHHVLCGRGYL